MSLSSCRSCLHSLTRSAGLLSGISRPQTDSSVAFAPPGDHHHHHHHHTPTTFVTEIELYSLATSQPACYSAEPCKKHKWAEMQGQEFQEIITKKGIPAAQICEYLLGTAWCFDKFDESEF